MVERVIAHEGDAVDFALDQNKTLCIVREIVCLKLAPVGDEVDLIVAYFLAREMDFLAVAAESMKHFETSLKMRGETATCALLLLEFWLLEICFRTGADYRQDPALPLCTEHRCRSAKRPFPA